MDGAVDVGQLYVPSCEEGEGKRGKKGWRDREAKRGKGGGRREGGSGRGRNALCRNAFFNPSFSALKATEDSMPWHPLLPEGSTTLKEQFWASGGCECVRIRTAEAMCLPAQHRWSAARSSWHLIRLFFTTSVPLSHTVLSRGLETLCSFTCPQVISQLNFLLRKPKHPGIVIPSSGSAPSTNTMSLLIIYTACIGDATYNSCSVNTCKMKGFHTENREIKNSTC